MYIVFCSMLTSPDSLKLQKFSPNLEMWRLLFDGVSVYLTRSRLRANDDNAAISKSLVVKEMLYEET